MNDLMFTNSRDANFACSRMQKTPPKTHAFHQSSFSTGCDNSSSAFSYFWVKIMLFAVCVYVCTTYNWSNNTRIQWWGHQKLLLLNAWGEVVMSEGKLASAFRCSYDPYIVNKWDVGSLNAPYQPSKQPSSINGC